MAPEWDFSKTYDWERLWYKDGEEPTWTDDGYTWVSKKNSKFSFRDKHLYSELQHVPFLVLLGEPGMGKSYALKRAFRQTQDSGRQSIFIDLGSKDDPRLLHESLFESTPFKDWVNSSGGEFTIFVDGVDECEHLTFRQMETFLTSELQRQCGTRVAECKVRLTCRDSRWNRSFEPALKAAWQADHIAVYRLCQLQRSDVQLAAVAHNLKADLFDEAISEKQAEHFAASPNTLIALMQYFQQTGKLPDNQWELFRSLCRVLSGEQNRNAQSSLNDLERLAIASRIAFYSVFMGKYVIDLDLDQRNLLSESNLDLRLSELSGGTVANGEDTVNVTYDSLRETLSTALFEFGGSGKQKWKQKTNAEFLAAYYIHSNGLSTKQVTGLLIQNGKPIVQVAETTSWLCVVRDDLFDIVVRSDPLALLSGDALPNTDEKRLTLVEQLFAHMMDGRLLEVETTDRRLRALTHELLSKQLEELLGKETLSIPARRLAVTMTGACRLEALEWKLADIALDSSENVTVRRRAAGVVRQIGSDECKLMLKPLLSQSVDTDSEMELLGYALYCCYPKLLSSVEMFEALRPQHENTAGIYSGFLHDLLELMPESDLDVALDWAAKLGAIDKQPRDFVDLITEFVFRAISSLDHPRVRSNFIAYLVSRQRFDDAPVGRDGEAIYRSQIGESKDRYDLLLEVINIIAISHPVESRDAAEIEPAEAIRNAMNSIDSLDVAGWLAFRCFLVTADDVPRLCRFAAECNSLRAREIAMYLIDRLLNWERLDHIDAVLPIRNLLDPAVKFDCDLSQHQKYLDLKQDADINLAENEPDDPKKREGYKTPSQELERLRELALSGDWGQWWRIVLTLLYHEDGRSGISEHQMNLLSYPGWKSASDEVREQLRYIAKRYLQTYDLKDEDWLGKTTYHRPAMSAYKAFKLLRSSGQEIEVELWGKWSLVLLAFSKEDVDNKENAIEAELLKLAPDAVLKRLDDLLEHDWLYEASSKVLLRIDWTQQLEEFVLNRINNCTKFSDKEVELVGHLLLRAFDEGKRLVLTLLGNSQRPEPKLVVALIKMLVRSSGDSEWDTVWTQLQIELLTEELLNALSLLSPKDFVLKLSEEQIGDLYVFIANRPELITLSPALCWGPVGSIKELHSALIEELRRRATLDSVNQLKRLAKALPDYVGLPGITQQAEFRLRASIWPRPTASDLKTLLKDSRRRVIQDSQQLMEAVIESLDRLQKKLQHSETPCAIDLWNENDSGYSPKVENRLSDYIKRHLDDELVQQQVLVCREPQIRAGDLPRFRDKKDKSKPRRSGQLVDVYAKSFDPALSTTFVVIIEVKGCWNKGLLSSVKTQLKKRYLQKNCFTHGIYVVGFYHCDIHYPNDKSAVACRKHSTIEEVRGLVDVACDTASTDGIKLSAVTLDLGLH